MRLVPKKLFYLFINYNVVNFKVHPFSSGAATVCSIPGTHFVGYRLRPALQISGCLLLTQNGVLSMPF
jgi:hypothetical protein